MLPNELLQKIRHIDIRTRHLVNDIFGGEYHSVFKGQGMEFDEVRLYQTGDEVRSIDWNVTARMGQPYIKRYVEERELTVMLVVDASGSGDFGSVSRFKRELAAELAAVLSFAATTNNDNVGLLIFTDQMELFIPARKGRRHVLRLIRELLAFQPEGKGTDIKLALDTVNHVLKRRSIVVLVSDFLAEPESYRTTLNITARRHDLIAVDLHDPLESEVADVGLMLLEDRETGNMQWVDTSDRGWRNLFAAEAQRHEAQKAQMFLSAKVDSIHVSTPDDYVLALTRFFDQRSRRRSR